MDLFKFGEKVEGYSIPVLNEREIRAAAGLLFVMMFIAIQLVIFRWDFTMLKFATTFFMADILIRVFLTPKLSPTLILGRLIVRNQVPEYVGAPQKRFAWFFGVILSLVMFITLVVLNQHGPINGLICMICLVFLFFETAFGICLGCKVYSLVYRKKAQYCPGEVCEPGSRHAIQKTSGAQLGFLLAVLLLAIAGTTQLGEFLRKEPALVMGMEMPPHIRQLASPEAAQ